MWFVSLSLVSCFRAPVVPPAPLVPPAGSGVVELEAIDGPDGVRLAGRTLWNGTPLTLRYQPLVRAGDRIGDEVFGQLVSRSGRALEVCEGLDYSGLRLSGGQPELISHFECQPGAIYRTALDASADGTLRATATRRVDMSAVDGGNFYCAGAPTRAGTHLASQEYEADARKRLPDGTVADNFEDYNALAAWWDGDLTAAHPWQYGWVVEVADRAPPARRWAMGRFSHELALPMPDDRTVYLSDDSAEGGALYLFQADRPGDFSAGILYAARWTLGEGARYDLSWRSLGHATDAEVAAVVARRPAFEDVFDVATPDGDRCPDGLALAWTHWGGECLRVKSGLEAAASRVEARRAAALAGATTELEKAEGMALDAGGSTLYLALSRYTRGAVTGARGPGARDDLQLAPNACGGVWALTLGAAGSPDGPTGPWIAQTASPRVQGVPTADARCDESSIANPDNLAWIEGTRILAIGEDGHRHARNALWFYDVAAGQLSRVLEAPSGAEVTGLRWAPDIAGHRYLSVAFQHAAPRHADGGGSARSEAGVIGPFPR